ncbi:hypothetical protein [Prescottella agglutinans]|uniref:Uncharacterized protein n=1 Tax=Prescottella agglutinans TaxID=1644129 RepID=A0ABT6M4X1_9NOCA|nr:hypothetical protein [Prescottella agglutinans]MDH6279361.1 hypothetical protein [Prescottella agglutinans]
MTITQQTVPKPFNGECVHGFQQHRTVPGYLQCLGFDWVRERREMEWIEVRTDGVLWCDASFTTFFDDADARRAHRFNRVLCPAGGDCQHKHDLVDLAGVTDHQAVLR